MEERDIETQRAGYLTLGKICLNETDYATFSSFIETLEDYNEDDEYLSTLNYVLEYLYEQKNYFILNLDWKTEVSELTASIKDILAKQFKQVIELPTQDDYGARASISYDNVFIDFDGALQQQGLQLGFIDTESDEYIIIVHKIEDAEQAQTAIDNIGYEYFNAQEID